MKYTDGNAAELKDKFWHEMSGSSYVMLRLDAEPGNAAPMTASLDKHANHSIWFFAGRDSRWAELGAATASYAAKGHDLFARFAGTLTEETDPARLDKQWSNFVEAWFPGGKDDPNLLMLRMDLGGASIWAGELGVVNTARMMLGMDVTDKVKGGYADVNL